MAVPQNLNLTLKAKLFQGLADPSRLAIVEALRSGERTVSELVAHTKLSQPNVSAHLACLKSCGLVVGRQEGRRVFYTLKDQRMKLLIEAAEGILSSISKKISSCSNYECQANEKCVSEECAAFIPLSPRQKRSESHHA